MPPLVKKISLIFLLLAIAGLIGWGLYYFFRKSAAGPAGVSQTAGGGTIGKLPTAGERGGAPSGEDGGAERGGLPAGARPPAPGPSYFASAPVEQATTDAALYPSLSTDGNLRYHNGANGKFYRILADGKIQEMVDQVFYNVQKVTWAKGRDKAVLEYPDGAKIVYDFELKKQQATLPKHWEDFTFSPEANEIAAKSLGLAPENRYLVVSKDDGTGTQLIEPLGDNADKVIMDWSPSRQTVAFSKTGNPQGAERREILFIGLHGENFKSAIVEGLDFQSQWSPTGKKLLYSVDSARSDFKPELWIINAYGDEIGSGRQMLQLNTWANKCAFADDSTVYCAVPRDLPRGAGMAPEAAADSYDDLYKIDVRTGLRSNVTLGRDFRFSSILYDSKHNKIFFTDRGQTGVFEIKM